MCVSLKLKTTILENYTFTIKAICQMFNLIINYSNRVEKKLPHRNRKLKKFG